MAGVAVGTVFRHFATKDDLVAAIMKRLLAGLVAQAEALGGPEGLFTLFRELIGQAASRRAVITLAGVDVGAALGALAAPAGRLLREAQAAGAVRADIEIGEVMALLTGLCQGALHGSWGPDLRQRTLAIVIAGLRG